MSILELDKATQFSGSQASLRSPLSLTSPRWPRTQDPRCCQIQAAGWRKGKEKGAKEWIKHWTHNRYSMFADGWKIIHEIRQRSAFSPWLPSSLFLPSPPQFFPLPLPSPPPMSGKVKLQNFPQLLPKLCFSKPVTQLVALSSWHKWWKWLVFPRTLLTQEVVLALAL